METLSFPKAHDYPEDLARFVTQQWCDRCPEGNLTLPPLPLLGQILSTCFLASLLSEESEPVMLRVVLLPPDAFELEAGPPTGFHRLVFRHRRPLTAYNLKKLSPSVELSHSLLGVEIDESGAPVIWGIVHSGTRWAEVFHGGRQTVPPLPSSLVVSLVGPGTLSVSNGSVVVAKLMGGQVRAPQDDVFSSEWMQLHFRGNLTEIWQSLPLEYGERLDFQLVRRITQGMFRRVLNMLRQQGQGATFLVVATPEDGLAEQEWIDCLEIKYAFEMEEATSRYRTLILQLLNRLLELKQEGPVSWEDYANSSDPGVAAFEEAQLEFCHLLVGLASVDGAVVLNRRFDVLGFGAEISGQMPLGHDFFRAVDIEAREVVPEGTDGVGSRHRSVFRMCQRFPEIMGVVVSQDGRVLVVKNNGGRVVAWDQLSTSPFDV